MPAQIRAAAALFAHRGHGGGLVWFQVYWGDASGLVPHFFRQFVQGFRPATP